MIFVKTTILIKFGIILQYTQEHFYHVGGSEKNRNHAIEALVTNLQSGMVADGKKINRQNGLFTDNCQSMHIAR